MQNTAPVFKEINHSESEYFHAGMDIYLNAFPSNERHSVKTIEERLDAGKSQMFVGLNEGKVITICLLFNLSDSEFILLDYMAVSNEFRGKGIGGKFLRYLTKLLKKINKYLVLEVENPEHGDNKEQRKSRIEFYKKNGAVKLKDVRYILPALDGKSPTEMNLMVLPEYHDITMKKETVRKLILELYKEVYGREEDDPLLNSFLGDLPEIITLT